MDVVPCSCMPPFEVIMRIFGYLPALSGVAKVAVLSRQWERVAGAVFGCLRRQGWVRAFVVEYLQGRNWTDVDWTKEFSWMSATAITLAKCSYVDQFGGYFARDSHALYRNGVPIMKFPSSLLRVSSYSVDPISKDVVVGVNTASQFVPSSHFDTNIIRIDPLGEVVFRMTLPKKETNGIAVHGKYVYSMVTDCSSINTTFLKIDTQEKSTIYKKLAVGQLAGISSDGNELYFHEVHVLWSYYTAQNYTHIFRTLNREGEILSSYEIEGEILQATVDSKGIWYFVEVHNEKIQLGIRLPNGVAGQFPLANIGQSICQIKKNEANGSLQIVSKLSDTYLLFEYRLRQM